MIINIMFNITLKFPHYRYFDGIFWNFEKDLFRRNIKLISCLMFNMTLRFLHYRYFDGIFWNFEKDLNYGEIRSV